MSLLQNAVDSIGLGLEDFDNPAAGRQLSATRNLFAGLLLIFKEKLRRCSPEGSDEILLYADVDVSKENGKLRIEPKKKKGKPDVDRRPRKTVDVKEIAWRFEVLGVQADWNRVNSLQDIRNDIEHRYTKATSEVIRQAVASTFLVIRDFVTRELDDHPSELLSEAVWQRLLDDGAVYEVEERECRETLDEVDWPSAHAHEIALDHRCRECHSNLVLVTNPWAEAPLIELRCRPCGAEDHLANIVEAGLRVRFRENAYLVARCRESPSLDRCPECQSRTYVLADDQCALCTYSRDYRECSQCGCDLQLEEQDMGGVCGACMHSAEKCKDS